MNRRWALGLMTALLIIISVAILSSVGRGHHLVLGEETEILPPTAPLMIKATVDEQGTTLNWQASQDGTFSVHTYQIYRQSSDGQFMQIGEVSIELNQYLDSAGKKANVYKLTSSDNQQPANISAYSDEITAVAVPAPVTNETATTIEISPDTEPVPLAQLPPTVTKISSNPSVSVAPLETALPAPQVSSNYIPRDLPNTVNPQEVAVNNVSDLRKTTASLPKDINQPPIDQQLQQVQKANDLRVAQLETVIVTAKQPLILPIIRQYSNQTQQLYQHFNQLTEPQKAVTKEACLQQKTALETQLLNLPEQYQMDLYIALAGCHLINHQP